MPKFKYLKDYKNVENTKELFWDKSDTCSYYNKTCTH